MIKDAYISADKVYRYSLFREWDAELPTMLFIMLNPSVADAVEDDPTIRRCINFAKREGCGALEVVNLFAFRATSPADMKSATDPVGPENDKILQDALFDTDTHTVVCGWGAHGPFRKRDQEVLDMIRCTGHIPYALGLTKDGIPRHPLYLKNEAPLEVI